jgi:hypothetical protein
MPLLSNMEERGQLKNAHQWLIQALEFRFGTISSELVNQINSLSDMDTLNTLGDERPNWKLVNYFSSQSIIYAFPNPHSRSRFG